MRINLYPESQRPDSLRGGHWQPQASLQAECLVSGISGDHDGYQDDSDVDVDVWAFESHRVLTLLPRLGDPPAVGRVGVPPWIRIIITISTIMVMVIMMMGVMVIMIMVMVMVIARRCSCSLTWLGDPDAALGCPWSPPAISGELVGKMELLELLGHVEDLRGPPVVSIGPIAMLGQELPMGLVGWWGSRSPWSSLARPASSLSSLMEWFITNLERLITLVVEKEMTEVMKVMDFLHLREIHVALVWNGVMKMVEKEMKVEKGGGEIEELLH